MKQEWWDALLKEVDGMTEEEAYSLAEDFGVVYDGEVKESFENETWLNSV